MQNPQQVLPTSCCDHVLIGRNSCSFTAQYLATQHCSVIVLIPCHHMQQPPLLMFTVLMPQSPLLMFIVLTPLLTSLCETDDTGQEAPGRLPVFLWKVLLVQMTPLVPKRQAHSVSLSVPTLYELRMDSTHIFGCTKFNCWGCCSCHHEPVGCLGHTAHRSLRKLWLQKLNSCLSE